MGRTTRVLVVLASLAGAFLIGALALAWLTPSPARDVVFVGGWDSDDARCGGPVVWSEGRAFAACDWFYDDRALVELDPESARATVLHRWSLDDGNTPELWIVRPCPGGRLFVVAETKQTTLVARRASGTTATSVPIAGKRVLGAECGANDVELFTEEESEYVVGGARDGRFEPRQKIDRASIDARVTGAWLEGGKWHVIGLRDDGRGINGAIGEPAKRFAVPYSFFRPCLLGDPGGWLCGGSVSRAFIAHESGVFRAESLEWEPETLALYLDPPAARGFGTEVLSGIRFDGLGANGFELAKTRSGFRAQRAGGPPVVVAKAAYSALAVSPHALPLSGGRVAIWGGLGGELVVLGPDLERTDALGMVARALRPFGRFRASSNSVFDRICYGVLLAMAPAWLIGLAVTYRRRLEAERRLRVAAIVFLALFAIGVASFLRVVAWM